MARVSAAERAAGAALLVGAAGTIVAMSHHPSDAHAAALGNTVHAAMIGLLTLMTWGLVQFAVQRGIWRALVSAGLLAYGISLFGHLAAASINGFAVPALVGRSGAAVDHDILLFAWEMNQAFAKLAVYMTSVAYLLWGVDLLRDRGSLGRLLGAAALVAGVLPPLLLLTGTLRMDVAGALLIYGIQVGWSALAGALLLAGRVQPSGYSATSS